MPTPPPSGSPGYTAKWKCSCGADNFVAWAATTMDCECSMCHRRAPSPAIGKVGDWSTPPPPTPPVIPPFNLEAGIPCMVDLRCKGCGSKYGFTHVTGRPGKPCPKCGTVPNMGSKPPAAGGFTLQPDTPPAPKSPKGIQAQMAEFAARFAEAGTCKTCHKAVWYWKSTNAEGKPTKYIFDRNPRMVFGVKFGPDGTTVVGIEKRTCWINHWDTCANRPK